MKFRHINPKNFSHLVPAWAVGVSPHGLASMLDAALQDAVKADKNYMRGFAERSWLEIDARTDNPTLRLAERDGGPGDGNAGWMIFDCPSPMGGTCQVKVPFFYVMKDYPDIRGTHCVYLHEMQGDGKILRYFGITKQRWFDRLAQHVSSSARGSRLVFHEAIRRNPEVMKIHHVYLAGASYEQAMAEEESLVDEFSLYPSGLNMIPGGFAGMAYLHKFGLRANTAQERDEFIERIAQRETVEGIPNPLCAARWASDQDFVNRIICGHGNRLSVEQVLNIRALGDFGKSADDIALRVGVPELRKVKNVLSGARYSRVG